MRYLNLLFCLVFTFTINAQTYFTDGMRWATKYTSTSSFEHPTWIRIVSLELANDENCFRMYEAKAENATERELIGYVKTEGDKVFFKYDENDAAEWYLFYDFGLQPGEGCYVYHANTYAYSNAEPIPGKTYIKCVGIEESSEFNGLPAMILEEYKDELDDTFCTHGVWIKGLSSALGVTMNTYFERDGGGSCLIHAEAADGTVIYTDGTMGVNTTTDSSLRITVNGNTAHVAADSEISGSLYSQAGLHIGDYRFNSTPTTILISEPGVYVLKTDATTHKILIK